MNTKHPRYGLIETFDKRSEFIGGKLERGIHENRMGVFSLQFFENGERVYPDSVKIEQVSHEFKFGCSLFLLDQFPEAERNAKYRESFKRLFNCGVVPIYWNTLEPEEGQPRFSSDSPNIWRRPALDTVRDYCVENGIRMKAHCLAYNSFNPDWLPESNRDINLALTRRTAALGERYRYDFEDMDVINEMYGVYKDCYKGSGNGMRDLKIVDEPDHEKFCFDLAKREFPLTRLFWNEGCFETFGQYAYVGPRSRYYLMLKEQLSRGTKIEGIGMQFHAFTGRENEVKAAGSLYNPSRLIDIFDCYSEFKLPIHLSEVSIPSWSNEPEDEEIQAELVKRMVTLWFSQKYVEAFIWWNLVDGTAYGDENVFHAGLMRNDLSPKAAYTALDKLINHDWHTSLERSGKDEELLFEGFYGDYEVTAAVGERKVTKKLRLFKDNTGYDNRLGDYRRTKIEL